MIVVDNHPQTLSNSRRRNGRVSNYAVSSSISRSLKGLLDSQRQLMAGSAILRPKLLIPVGIKEPASAVPNHSGLYRTHLFRRVVKRHSVNLSVGNLLQVLGVRADP